MGKKNKKKKKSQESSQIFTRVELPSDLDYVPTAQEYRRLIVDFNNTVNALEDADNMVDHLASENKSLAATVEWKSQYSDEYRDQKNKLELELSHAENERDEARFRFKFSAVVLIVIAIAIFVTTSVQVEVKHSPADKSEAQQAAE